METGELHCMLGRIRRLHYKYSYTRFSKNGITQGQPRLLSHLFRNDGCIQKNIAENCDLEPATVTNILANMERSGLIRRENDPADRRILRVYLTQKGRGAHEIVTKTFNELEDVCFEGFSTTEREQTMDFFTRIIDNLQKSEAQHVSPDKTEP